MINYEKIISISRDYILFIDERIKAQVLQPVTGYAAKKTSATGAVVWDARHWVQLLPDSADFRYINAGNLTFGSNQV
jgi:hypothetical protein